MSAYTYSHIYTLTHIQICAKCLCDVCVCVFVYKCNAAIGECDCRLYAAAYLLKCVFWGLYVRVCVCMCVFEYVQNSEIVFLFKFYSLNMFFCYVVNLTVKYGYGHFQSHQTTPTSMEKMTVTAKF